MGLDALRPTVAGRASARSALARTALARTGFIRSAAAPAGALVDLLFPPSCLACWGAMRFIARPFCERLGTPFAADYGGEGLVSPDAIANPPAYGRARAVTLYENGPARTLVHRLKYGDRLELAGAMGRWMARAGDEILGEADLLLPVPLHRRRLFARRFNQAALLAQTIAAETGVPADPLALERVKPTPPQVGLTRTARATNVQGAFRVSPAGRGRIAGRAVVIVDDVLTSGATVNAVARAALRGGARRVDALVFARVAAG